MNNFKNNYIKIQCGKWHDYSGYLEQWLPMGVALATCRHTGYIRIGYATYKLSFKASNYSFELWFWVWCVFNSLDNNALSA